MIASLLHVPIALGLALVAISAAWTVGYLHVLFNDTVADIHGQTHPTKVTLRVLLLFAILGAAVIATVISTTAAMTILYVLTGWPA